MQFIPSRIDILNRDSAELTGIYDNIIKRDYITFNTLITFPTSEINV